MGHNSPVWALMRFVWLIFLLWVEGTPCGDGWSWALRSPTLGHPQNVFTSSPSENRAFSKKNLFINISQVPQEKPWRWIASQLMDGDGDGIRTFKTNMENGASWTRAYTHTHAQEPWSDARAMFWLAERDPWWPPKHPWCWGRELSGAQRYVLFIVLYCI